MAVTQWGYVFSYRVSLPGDKFAEPSGTANATERLDEMSLMNLVLEDASRSDTFRPHVSGTEDMIITRFTYTEVSPVPVPVPDTDQD
jgi:hypothetical protein